MKNNGQINVALIGCGRIADLHVPGYRDNPRARIFAVCDSDRETARARGKEWGAERVFADYRELLADPDVDAVEILTPHALHEEMVIAAARAGKHVALQKPMTNDLASADRMLAAARENVRERGRVFRLTDNYAFYPPIVRARKMIAAGDLGDPITLRIKFIGGGSGGWEVPAAAWRWRMQEAAAGRGMQTFDHGHHLWTTAWYLLGSVERVAGWIDTLDGITDSPSLLIWKYADQKAYGVCEFAHARDLRIPGKYYANDEWIEITGSRGILFIHRCTGEIHEGPPMSFFDGDALRPIEDVDSDWGAGFAGATRNFIAAIRGEEEPLLAGDDAREVLRFTLAVAKAGRVRREVFPEELDASFPNLYALRRRRRELRAAGPERPGLLERLGIARNYGRYAPRAVELTQELAARFDPDAAPGWTSVIGLRLTPEGQAGEATFTLYIKDGAARLEEGPVAADAAMTLSVPAGVWAAILLKKKRIETALIQGKLKVEGHAEEGLKLRGAFGL